MNIREKIKMAVIGAHLSDWPVKRPSEYILYDLANGVNLDDYTVHEYFQDWHKPELVNHMNDMINRIEFILNAGERYRSHPKLIRDLKEITEALEKEHEYNAKHDL